MPDGISKLPFSKSGRYRFTPFINLAQICIGNPDPVNPFEASNGGKLLSNPTHTTTMSHGVKQTNHRSLSPVPVFPASETVEAKPKSFRAILAVPYWPSGPSPITL